MKKRLTMLIAALSLFAPLKFAWPGVAEATITGKWITDTVVIAAQQKKAMEDARRANMPDPFAQQGFGARGGRGVRGGARARGGNNFLPAESSYRQEPKRGADPKEESDTESNEPFMPAITMDLKMDTKNKLTGTIVETSPEDLTDAKMKVEDATITGKSFKFVTYVKKNSVQVGISWAGELVNDNSIKLVRKQLSGKPFDEIGDVIFTRTR